MYDGFEIDRDRDNTWLLGHAAQLLASQSSKPAELASCTSWLTDAILETSSQDLRRQYGAARSRLFRELDKRNKEWADLIFVDCGKYLAEAEDGHASVIANPGARNAFDRAGERLLWTSRGLGLLQTKKYLIPFVKPRNDELVALKERLAELTRKHDELRVQVISAVNSKAQAERTAKEAVEREIVEAEVRAKEDARRFREESLAVCRVRMEAGDLAGAKLLLEGIEPIKRKMVRKSVGYGYTFIPDDPELAVLDERLIELFIVEAIRLKGLVDESVGWKDFTGATQYISALESLDARAITKVFGGPEQVAMLKQRCHKQLQGVRKSPREIRQIK
ncbi:MAG: hypothetical protein Q7S57_01790 [bacterium]|nr:hypothetical protein [bacterium]